MAGSNRKFVLSTYTVVTIGPEDDPPPEDLEYLLEYTSEGPGLMVMAQRADTVVDAVAAASWADMAGSDPGFFMLTTHGEETDNEDVT